MIICCNKQEAVVEGPSGRNVSFKLWLTTDLVLLFVSAVLSCSVFDLDQKERRMLQSTMSVTRVSVSDNITHSTALVTALDNVTTLSPTTQAINDTNITVPHKCLLLLYEDIGKSRWDGGNGTMVWPWNSGKSFLSLDLVEKGLVPSLLDAEDQEKKMFCLLFAESATGIFCSWFPMCFSLCFFSGSCPLPGPKSGSLPAQSSLHSTY